MYIWRKIQSNNIEHHILKWYIEVNLVGVDMIVSNLCTQWKMLSLGLIHPSTWHKRKKKTGDSNNQTKISILLYICFRFVRWCLYAVALIFNNNQNYSMEKCRFSYWISSFSTSLTLNQYHSMPTTKPTEHQQQVVRI